MSENNDAEVACEIYESVISSQTNQKRLKSSTFWKLFNVKSRQKEKIEEISRIISAQGLNIKVKSGSKFGEEDKSDWIILTSKIAPEPPPPFSSDPPADSWFEVIKTRIFETERKVETYFVAPLLEKLGYQYDDICIGYSFEIFKGVKKIKAEADFVVFNGNSRDKKDVLLVVEAKSSSKKINADHIGQARSYSHELLPSNYIISNGEQIVVFKFYGSLIPDEKVMDFNRSDLKEYWSEFYSYVSKDATSKRKKWMIEIISGKSKI